MYEFSHFDGGRDACELLYPPNTVIIASEIFQIRRHALNYLTCSSQNEYMSIPDKYKQLAQVREEFGCVSRMLLTYFGMW